MKAFTLFGSENLLYLILSAIISAIGLLGDSKEVVIGSMLISPLFVPIINANKPQGGDLIHNVLVLIGSVVFSIVIGYISSKLSNKNEETSEMVSRTKWDSTKRGALLNYLTPLISGIVIALSIKSKNIIPIVGAGIAIAFMPPLVNSGIYLGESKPTKAWHSLKLALANICISAFAYTITTQCFSIKS